MGTNTNTETTKGKGKAAKALTTGKKLTKGKAAAKVATKGKGKPAKAAKAAKGKRTFTLAPNDGRYNPYRFTDDMPIKAKAKENPYREESEAHKWYAVALKAGTVGKFKAAIKAGKADPAAKFPFDHLRIARRSGYLTVGGK